MLDAVKPVVHTRSDGVLQWWQWLRESIGETKDTLGGFYTLRHLGATEYGSRKGCSIVAMKQWLTTPPSGRDVSTCLSEQSIHMRKLRGAIPSPSPDLAPSLPAP